MNLSRGNQIAIFNLLIVGIIGSLLRLYFVYPIPGFNFQFVLHGHSHLAFLGWVFMALYIVLTYAYLSPEKLKSGKYPILFLILQGANLGMLGTFPWTGYAQWSIAFSTIHALGTLFFAWTFIRDVQPNLPQKHQASFQFVKWALILMMISNLAPFALGPISAFQGKNNLYHLTIYFYMHFQYNGWFTFALLGMILWLLERRGANTQTKLIKRAFFLKLAAVFPAYILSALWTQPGLVWHFLGGFVSLVQLIGLGYFLVFILKNLGFLISRKSVHQKIILWCGILGISIQHILMFLSAFPFLGKMAFARPIVIAYLHLVLIGFVTHWLFFLFLKMKFTLETFSSKIGFYLFLAAFLATEIILVFQSLISESFIMLFILAVIQVLGIICILFNTQKKKPYAEGFVL